MPLLKRKPVHLIPLPSLTSILQPLPLSLNPLASSNQVGPNGSPTSPATLSPSTAELETLLPPLDGKDDDEQLDRLINVLSDPSTSARRVRATPLAESLLAVNENEAVNGQGGDGEGTEEKKSKKTARKSTGVVNDATPGRPVPEQQGTVLLPYPAWKVKNLEVFYIPETGEICLDYESYAARRAFYSQSMFQCEVSGRSSLSYFKAQQSEAKEVQALHSRFPRQLKKAVLSAVQFQIEGKLETLVDRIFERFHNRFFDDEKVFVDVQGDKYLARVAKTYPPKNLHPPPDAPLTTHPYATNLSLPIDQVNELDDPMKYFYAVRLIREGGSGERGTDGGATAEYASTNEHGDEDDGGNEQWQTSLMEVQADKISRDRINFSRAMLKRFIRDCVHRDSPVYSPWLVKPSVATRYGLPREIPPAILASITSHKKEQMEKRKREREERLGISTAAASSEVEIDEVEEGGEKPVKKKKSRAKSDKDKEKEKEEKEKEKERKAAEIAAAKAAEEEAKAAAKAAEEEAKKKKPTKYPAEDLLVEYAPERDGPAGRIEVRPAPLTELPFGDRFEQLLMAWSFLNVMGEPLRLSPFSLDDFEHALSHTDPHTSPCTLIVEIHATLLNALIRDLEGDTDVTSALSRTVERNDNDTDYWEGRKGATVETIRPVASNYMNTWKKELSPRDNRKGWEGALIGCLWERATMETLPHYLDNILHLTHEDKPAPTRPTWSTGPSTAASNSGLILSKSVEKRYMNLSKEDKLDIITWLIEMVGQTSSVREYMEECNAALTEIRKEQVDQRRELRRIQSERAALEPKPENATEGEEQHVNGEGDGMDGGVVNKASSPPSTNGHANGGGTERDELESVLDPTGSDRRERGRDPERFKDVMYGASGHHADTDAMSSTSRASTPDRANTGNRRRQAMREKAAEREAEEAIKAAKRAAALIDAKNRRADAKAIAIEKKKLADEESLILSRIRKLDIDFRALIHTFRVRPMGLDRFGNKIWWIDGLGSSPLIGEGGKVNVATGRVWVQGSDELELELIRESVGDLISREEVEERREKEEMGRLEPGQWGVYDSPEQLNDFVNWLNPRGLRELQLLRQLKLWLPEIEAGMRRRRLLIGLDQQPQPVHHVGDDEHARRSGRNIARKFGGGGVGGADEGEGFLSWKNRRA